jgi:hypothetical protein
MVLELSSWRHRVSGICFHGFIGAGVLSLIDGSDWTDSKGGASGTVLFCGDCSPTFSREIKNGLAPKAPKINSSIARAVNLFVRSCCFSASCTSVILSSSGLMLSPHGEAAKALETDHALMPEADEGFDFTSCLECGARVCRGKKPVNTNRNYGDHVYTIDTFSRFNTIRCSLRL